MGRGGFEKRSRRRSVYYVVSFLAISVVGTVMIVLLLAAGKQRVRSRLYKDPELTLLHVFAETETRWLLAHHSYAKLDELVSGGAISDEFLLGPVEGYRYRVVRADQASFVATAEPEGPAPPPEPPKDPNLPPPKPRPRRFYYVDETHTIRAEDTKPAGPTSEVVWSPRDDMAR